MYRQGRAAVAVGVAEHYGLRPGVTLKHGMDDRGGVAALVVVPAEGNVQAPPVESKVEVEPVRDGQRDTVRPGGAVECVVIHGIGVVVLVRGAYELVRQARGIQLPRLLWQHRRGIEPVEREVEQPVVNRQDRLTLRHTAELP